MGLIYAVLAVIVILWMCEIVSLVAMFVGRPQRRRVL